MNASFRGVTVALSIVLLGLPVAAALATSDARADDGGAGDAGAGDAGDFASDANSPCGTFDFSSGISCSIQVSGGCTAQCTPIKFEAACSGHCTSTATQTCTDTCGTQCVAQCDPQLLDCFSGCHTECDQPLIDQCMKSHPGTDCVNSAKAQCDIHCKDSCKVPPSNCQEHCTKCCSGSCTTQVNYDCDYSCMADVEGGCSVACSKPEGAIFCNGQYVNATSVEQCITYLATKGLQVDVSARAQATCDLSGCKGAGTATGCAASPGSNAGFGGALAVIGLAAAAGVMRARRREPARRAVRVRR
jgi:hypothetical protein